MKRSSASTAAGRRKRIGSTETVEAARPRGALAEEEIRALRDAYLDGATGSVLIGLRGDQRLPPQLLPAQPDLGSAARQMERVMAEMEKLGADGHILARRAKLRTKKRGRPKMVILIEEFLGGRRKQVVKTLRQSRIWRTDSPCAES